MTKKLPLFRKKSIEAKNSLGHGGVSVRVPTKYRHLILLVSFIISVFIVFSLFAEVNRKVTVGGVLIPNGGYSTMYALNDGVINKIHVKNGEFVHKGDVLVSVDTLQYSSMSVNDQDSQLDSLKDRIQRRQEEIRILNRGYLDDVDYNSKKIEALKAELKLINDQLDILFKSTEILEKKKKYSAKLYSSNLLSRDEYNISEKELLDSQSLIKQKEIDMSNKSEEINEHQYNIKQAKFNYERSANSIRIEISELKDLRSKLKNEYGYKIVASRSGKVQLEEIEVGDAIKSKDRILSIIPRNPVYYARIYAGNNVIGLLDLSMEVKLRLDPYPAEHFGTVKSQIDKISFIPLSSSGADNNTSNNSEYFIVEARIKRQGIYKNNKEYKFKPGMSFNADIVLEKRTLFSWMFEPIIKLKDRI